MFVHLDVREHDFIVDLSENFYKIVVLILVIFRWQLPNSENSVLASTANDLRSDKYTPINPEKLKAAAAGLSQSRTWFLSYKICWFQINQVMS